VGTLLLQAPPGTALPIVVVCPSHTVPAPVIGPGIGITDTSKVVLQLPGIVYVITVKPAAIPPTTPVVRPTVPFVGALLLHVPPVVALASDVVAPTHICDVPVIGSGDVFTVTTVVTVHPAGKA